MSMRAHKDTSLLESRLTTCCSTLVTIGDISSTHFSGAKAMLRYYTPQTF